MIHPPRIAPISALLLLAGLGFLRRLNAQEDNKPKSLERMEFRQTSSESELEWLGNEGWQLVGGVQRDNYSSITYLLQRPKQEEKPIAEDVIKQRTAKEWVEFAANARAKSNRELARKVLLTIATRHKGGNEPLSLEDQQLIRDEALKLLAGNDLELRVYAAKLLRPVVDDSCRAPLQQAAEEALKVQQADKQVAREEALLSEILKTLRPVADDTNVAFLARLAKAPSAWSGRFLSVKILGKIDSPAARKSLEEISQDKENHQFVRDLADEQLDRMDFEQRGKRN